MVEIHSYPTDEPWHDADDYLMAPLLACGHYARPAHCASSIWEFPADPEQCPTCGDLRQMAPHLQAALTAGDDLTWEDKRIPR
jgi:hypothetical protein